MSAPLSHHIKYQVSRWLTGDMSVPFHMIYHEPWDGNFVREYRRAWRYYRKIAKSALRRVWVLSYSCSGTHNFYTHFHYLPCAFAFGENLFKDEQEDPYQLRWNPGRLRPAHFLFGSAFLQQGLQVKDGARLSNIFLLSNNYLKFHHPVDLSCLGSEDRMIFYQRNFIRVLFSQNRDSKKFNRPHFLVTDEYFATAVANHRRKIDEMLQLVALHPDRVMFCFHEIFCAAPGRIMDALCDGIGISREERAGWDDPVGFFKRCYRSDEPPERRGDTLWCTVLNVPIRGKGGEYNPLPPISLARTINAPIREWISPARYEHLCRFFGRPLVDFWLHDDTFDYAGATTQMLVEIIRSSLPKCPA